MNLSTASSSSLSSSSSSSTTSWLSGIVRGRFDKSASAKMAKNSAIAGGESVGPINLKNQFRGVMFKYGPNPIQVAFKTGDYKQQVIFIGGLTDGFLATEYLNPLAIALEKEKWSLVQFLLSSSYSGYGISSLKQMPTCPLRVKIKFPSEAKRLLASPLLAKLLFMEASESAREFLGICTRDRPWSFWATAKPYFSASELFEGAKPNPLIWDAMELDQLISYLINKEDSEGVVLLGHSTGCQDIVYYMRTNAACSRAVRAAIFQGPVSDREFRATLSETAAMIDLASKLISEGRGSELMPREANQDSPITAYRYHSICAYMGDDDMFSSDLSDDQLKQRLGHMSSTPCQVIFSMADEYVPDYVDKKALVDRLCRAMGGAEKVEIEWGNHSLSNRVEEAVQAIMGFVKREGPSGWDDPWS